VSQSILKSSVSLLSKEYPNVEKSTFMAVCKTQFSWALREKVEKGMCPEAQGAMVFMRETDVFVNEMDVLAAKARNQYKAGVDEVVADEKN